jgi:hypothetical protein
MTVSTRLSISAGRFVGGVAGIADSISLNKAKAARKPKYLQLKVRSV